MLKISEQEAVILTAAQRGIPLVRQPFSQMAEKIGVTTDQCVKTVKNAVENGTARRFGGVFDARRLGFRSALCAMQVTRSQLERVAGIIAETPGVTHAYERGWPLELLRNLPGGPHEHDWPNFWFTLVAPTHTFNQEAERLRSLCQPFAIHTLPALRRFKIDVTFDLRTRERDERVAPPLPMQEEQPAIKLSETDIRIIEALEGSIPVDDNCFAELATQLEITEEVLIAKLQAWKECGVLRRIALFLYHRKAGFHANGMCCWSVPPQQEVEAGRLLASFPEVTHCYTRNALDIFPFQLYAMIHTPAWETTRQLFEKLSHACNLSNGQLLLSLTEFKKTSMRYAIDLKPTQENLS